MRKLLDEYEKEKSETLVIQIGTLLRKLRRNRVILGGISKIAKRRHIGVISFSNIEGLNRNFQRLKEKRGEILREIREIEKKDGYSDMEEPS